MKTHPPTGFSSHATEMIRSVYPGMPDALLYPKMRVAAEVIEVIEWPKDAPRSVGVLYQNPAHWQTTKTLFFGNFEAVTEEDGLALISQIVERAQRLGAEHLIGPINGNTWNDYRLNRSGAVPVFPGEPFNPLFYHDVMINGGFSERHTYSSGLDERLEFNETAEQELLAELHAQGVSFRTVDRDHVERDMRAIFELSTKAFRKNFLYSGIEWKEYLDKYQHFLNGLDTSFCTLAERGEDLAGFMFAFSNPLDQHASLVIKTVARDPDMSPPGLGKYLVGHTTMLAHKASKSRLIHALMPDASHSNVISQVYSGVPFRKYSLYSIDFTGHGSH